MRKIELHVPQRGHALCVVNLDAPEATEYAGPDGLRGRLIERLDDGSALFAFESLWELHPVEPAREFHKGIFEGTKWLTAEVEPVAHPVGNPFRAHPAVGNPFRAHPAVWDNPAELLPEVQPEGGDPLAQTAQVVEVNTDALKRVRFELDSPELAVTVWATFQTRSPAVPIRARARRKDGSTWAGELRLRFGEDLALLPVTERRSRWGGASVQRPRTGAVTLAWRPMLDTAEHASLHAVLLCDSAGIDGNVPDVLTLDALEAAQRGPFFGVENRVGGAWLGAPIGLHVTTGKAMARQVRALLDAYTNNTPPPHVSADHPHASGNQGGFGIAYPIAHTEVRDPRIVVASLWQADDWERRPTAYREPGPGSVPVQSQNRPHFGTKTRRPFDGRGPDNFRRLGLEPITGRSEWRDRKGHDDEHMLGAQEATAAKLTGDPLLRDQIRGELQLDLAQQQVRIRSAGKARAVGRVLVSMLQCSHALAEGDPVRARVVTHAETIVRLAAQRLAEHDGVAIGREDDARSECDWPCGTPYEEALAAFGAALLARQVGGWSAETATVVESCARFVARSVVTTSRNVLLVPYRVSFDAEPSEVFLGSSKVHPGDFRAWSDPATTAAAMLIEAGLWTEADARKLVDLGTQNAITDWQRPSDVFSAVGVAPIEKLASG